MSENRRHACDNEITFGTFVKACRARPIVRVQGRVESGRSTRFNRAVMILPDTIETDRDGRPCVIAERVRWDRNAGAFVLTGERMILAWRLLDWVSWTATGDPNGTWLKVTNPD